MTSGIVTITGQVERRASAPYLIDAVRGVEGVAGVRDRVSYPRNDPPKLARRFWRRSHSLAVG